MKKGERVKVDFISESRTEFSGKRFHGFGVLDRVEDGQYMGVWMMARRLVAHVKMWKSFHQSICAKNLNHFSQSSHFITR